MKWHWYIALILHLQIFSSVSISSAQTATDLQKGVPAIDEVPAEINGVAFDGAGEPITGATLFYEYGVDLQRKIRLCAEARSTESR